MRKTLILISMVLTFAVAPVLVSAQGFSAMCGMANGCDEPYKIILTGAYVTNFGDTNYSIDSEAGDITTATGGLRFGRWSYNYNSFQMGLGIPVDLGKMGLLVASGTIAIPTGDMGDEYLTDGTNGAAGVLMSNTWNADTYYATLEALYAYPVIGNWYALGGFRWVNWQTSYKNSDKLYDPGALRGADDAADVTVNGYVPFLGVMTSMGSMTVGAVGIPTTVGTVDHRERLAGADYSLKGTGDFDGGYFAEVFMDYAVPTFDMDGMDASFSLFVKASWLNTTATLKLRELENDLEQSFDFNLNRNLFFIGGKATVNFDLPGLPGGLL